MKTDKPSRIILAVDLKSQEPRLVRRVWKTLKPWLNGKRVVVEPVTILGQEDAAIELALKSRIGALRAAAERHLGEQLAGMGLKDLAPPKVLFAPDSSIQGAVRTLLKYAGKTGCELIAVSSHNRKNVKRFFLGSFAETLSLQSPIPLLVVNPNQRTTEAKVKRILFPTDFSAKSREALNTVCGSFRDEKPTIVLFHNFCPPLPFHLEPFAALPIPQTAIEDNYQEIRKQAQKWLYELRAQGIPSKAVIDRKMASVIEGILSAGKRERVDLIAMVSTSGKWERHFLGSTTLRVLRTSPKPVWVVHPMETQKKGRILKFPRSAAARLPATAASTSTPY